MPESAGDARSEAGRDAPLQADDEAVIAEKGAAGTVGFGMPGSGMPVSEEAAEEPARENTAHQNPELTPEISRLVRILASRVLSALPRDCGIELSDLIQAGNLGLLQAARTFSPESGAPLSGYAKFRIRGEMLDTVRRHTALRRASSATQASTTDDATDLESTLPAPPEHSPHSLLARSQRATILGQEVARLPARYRTVVRLRYSNEFSLREIGAVLRVHESRACQLHRSALGRLRRALLQRGLRGISTLM
jgi:RNA polymerase sigma factor for flagellar operon FliA